MIQALLNKETKKPEEYFVSSRLADLYSLCHLPSYRPKYYWVKLSSIFQNTLCQPLEGIVCSTKGEIINVLQ